MPFLEDWALLRLPCLFSRSQIQESCQREEARQESIGTKLQKLCTSPFLPLFLLPLMRRLAEDLDIGIEHVSPSSAPQLPSFSFQFKPLACIYFKIQVLRWPFSEPGLVGGSVLIGLILTLGC